MGTFTNSCWLLTNFFNCPVIMPRLDINLDELKPWCLFHNVHGCPCDKYKDPLEYGPDVNTSRNVARRSIGNKFKTKFTTEKIVRKPSTTTDQDVTLMNEGISYDFFVFFPSWFLITLTCQIIVKQILIFFGKKTPEICHLHDYLAG